MKVQLNCKEHDFENQGQVRCQDLMKSTTDHYFFGCPHVHECMCKVSSALLNATKTSEKVWQTSNKAQKELVEEFINQEGYEYQEDPGKILVEINN